MSAWKTINRVKLEKEIDERSAKLDALAKGSAKMTDLVEAVEYNRILAEHNALVALFNCLD